MSTDVMAAAVPLTKSEDVPNAGISSPPDSNDALKLDSSDSELSDIEDPEEDLGEVLPDRYEGGVPIFTPTMDQFKSFTPYMKKINHIGMKTGIVKVIPPKEWKDNLPPLDQAIKTIKVKDPIAQEITGTGGTYRQLNIQHQRSYNLPQWRQLCEQSEHQPPAKRGERRANQDNNSRLGPRTRGTPTPGSSSAKKRGPGRPTKKTAAVDKTDGGDITVETPDRLPTPVSPPVKAEDYMESIKNEADDETVTPNKSKGGRQAPAIASVSSRRKYNRREAAGKIDEAAFKDFEYRLVGEEFTKERCEELERAYWKTLTYAPPLYGADMPGSLFDESVSSWNLGKLDNLLDILGTKIPGVNTAYLYLGMWKATFAWHLEDVDLYSINFNHFGAPKQWYSISQKDARRFEAAMKSIWPADTKACDQFLRHKTFLISPTTLWEKYSVKVNKVVHHPGEFVITFPYGYHSGFNLGYNAAEAVNFAMESWLELGRVAKKCDCDQAQDSVWIDEHDMRKLRGEETEYEESDEDGEDEDGEGPTDLPTPPWSSGGSQVKGSRPKRKRPANDTSQHSGKRIRLRIPSRQPCLLCPNDIPSESLLPTDDGRKAHRICASYIPETDIETREDGTEIVTGTTLISKARLELKCGYCKSKKGAAFQCSQKKCTRAFHATCAAPAGVFVEEGETAVFGPDGTEYKEYAFEFSCRFHRVKRDKRLDSYALEEDQRIHTAASKAVAGEKHQFQFHKADIFAGIIVENRADEEMLLITVLPKGDRIEVPYKFLLLPDPADYRLPKPSANAIPLPRKSKESLVTSKRQVNDLPRKEDLFVPGFTWEEFHTVKLDHNPAQVILDLEKENQIWYYLGKNSTDAKAQFTEDLLNPRHNPKGHFLDTIPKPAPVASSRHSYPASYPSSGVNQHALNAARAISRPSLPQNLSRSEKPYEYKPRGNNDYRVDPQAYRSQQKFLQKSVLPFSFGSDPNYSSDRQWPSTDERGPLFYSPYRPTTQLPSPLNLIGPNPRPVSSMQVSPKPLNPFSNPSTNNHNNNSRVSSGGRYYSKPNPFAKYPYLQKQHNRSPLDYKSPYSQGGGFMNGYEGDLKEHLKRNPDALFRMQRSSSQSSSVTPNPLLAYNQSHRTKFSPTLPYPHLPENAGGALSYRPSAMPAYTAAALASPYASKNGHAVPNRQPQLVPHASNSTAANVWEKKDSPLLHPAIRQEYGTVFHHQYQPSVQTNEPSQQPLNGHQSPYQTSALGQQYQPPTISQQRQQTQMSQSQQPHSQSQLAAAPLPNFQSHQPQRSQLQENKQPLYAHQQYFQNPQTPAQQHMQPDSSTREVPDVPADSTSLVEKLMANLRQASRQT